MEHRHILRKPTFSGLLDLKLATVQFFHGARREKLDQGQSFLFFNLCIRTAEAEFLPTATSHRSSSRVVVFIKVIPSSRLFFITEIIM